MSRKGSMGGPGAKLAALFSQDEQWKTSGNQSMKYNPAPLSAASSSSTPETPSTEFLFTAAINLIQYDAAGTANNLGARGMALLFQLATRSYHLVCYETSSQKQDCSVTINGNFKLLLPGGNYCAFFDEKQQYWCTHLSSEEQVSSLAQAVACVNHAQLSRVTAEGASMPLVMQDLAPDPAPEAKPLANGDSVKIKYTMYLLAPTHPKNPLTGTIVGSVTQPKLVKLGAGKELKGLEVGLLGMKKGGSRLLLIPPEQAYGSTAAGAIPANSTLLVLVNVTAAKYAGEKKSKAEEEPAETSGPPPITTTAPVPSQPPPPANTDDDPNNNNLLKRIAQQSGGFSMANLAGMKPSSARSSPVISQPTPTVMPTHQPLGPSATMFNPMSQYSPEQMLQMQQQFQQQQQQQQQLLQQLGMFGATGLPGMAALAPGGLSGLGVPGSGVPGGVPGFPSAGLHSAPPTPAGPTVSDQKQIVLLETMARRIDTIHASLSGSPELTEGLEGALSGYEVVRALQNSLKDRERTKAAMEANKKKMAQMQDKIDELRSASDTSRSETASSWEKRMEAFQEDAKQRQALIADLTKEKKELQAALMGKSQELSDVSFKLNLAQTDLERSIASGGNVQELQKQAVDAKAELSSVKASLASLASEKASQLAELRATHAAEIASLQAQHQEALAALNAKLGGEMQTEQRKAGEASLALTTQANLLQGQVDQLTTQLKQHQGQVEDLNTQLKQQQTKIDDFTTQLQQQKAQVDDLTSQLNQQQQANEILKTKEEEERTAKVTAQEGLAAANAKLEASSSSPTVGEDEMKARLKEEYEAGKAAGMLQGGESSSQALLKDQESTHALLNGLKETIANLELKLNEAAAEKEEVVIQSKAVIKKLREQLNHAKETGDPDFVLGELLELLSAAIETDATYEGATILTVVKKAMRRVSNQVRAAMEAVPRASDSQPVSQALDATVTAASEVSSHAAPSVGEEKTNEATPGAPGGLISQPEDASVPADPSPTQIDAVSDVPQPETVLAQPDATAEPEVVIVQPETVTAQSEPVTKSEPVATQSEPVTTQSDAQSEVLPENKTESVAIGDAAQTENFSAETEGEQAGGSSDPGFGEPLPKSPVIESDQPGLDPLNIVLPPSSHPDAEGE